MAIPTSALVPCWNRPTTSRVSAGLRLSKVSPEVESHHSPAMKFRKVGVSTALSVMVASVRRRAATSPAGGEPIGDRQLVLVIQVPEHVDLDVGLALEPRKAR